MSFGYDPWGNRLQQNVTAGVAGTSQLNVDSRNRITGAPVNCTAADAYCYDAAGDLLNDGFHQYTYDAESRIQQVDGGAATYTYDADGQRVHKTAASGSTDYVYFGGSIIAEKNVSNGNWTDYVFVAGKRLARSESMDRQLHITGTACSTCSGQYQTFELLDANGAPALYGHVVQSGDQMYVRQYVQAGITAGIGVCLTNGNCAGSYSLSDQDGISMMRDSSTSWHYRRVDLSAMIGQTIQYAYVIALPTTTSGTWHGWFEDIALAGADGTVYPVYTQEASIPVSTWGYGQSNVAYTFDAVSSPDVKANTYYYHGDQIGSARLLTSSGGWPVWQGTFLPFGEEYNPQISSNHYKFSGMEHDAESGLENYGARQYGSKLGRFIGPDEPFIDQHKSNPQSWNLYSYGRNNPIKNIDPSGNACVTADRGKTYHNDNSGGESCEDFEKNKSAHPYVVEGNADPQSTLLQGVFHSPDAQATWKNSAGAGNFLASVLTFHWLAPKPPDCPPPMECMIGVAFPTGIGAEEEFGTLGFQRPAATDPKLQKIINKLYQDTDTVPGGTAGAVRHENATGQMLSKAGHRQDALDTARELSNYLKSHPGISTHDQNLAKHLIQDLLNSVIGKP